MIKFYSNSMIETDMCSSLSHFMLKLISSWVLLFFINKQLGFVVLY